MDMKISEQKFREILALNLKVARVKKSLTQEQLAEKADISTKHLTKIENKKVTPSSFMLYNLAKVLNVSVDSLLEEQK